MTRSKTALKKPKKYDIYGYELKDRYDGNVIPTRMRYDGSELKHPKIDIRIPLCKCGHNRENHFPCEGNWSCSDEDCSKQGSYCWFYEPEERSVSYKEQIGKQAQGVTREGQWDAEINDYEKFLRDNPRYNTTYEATPYEEDQLYDDSVDPADRIIEYLDAGLQEPQDEPHRERWQDGVERPSDHGKLPKREKPRVATSTRAGSGGSASTRSVKPKKAMKPSRAKEYKKCPRCNENYEKLQALSRRDNKTKICSMCGTTEALLDAKSIMKVPSRLLLQEEEFQRKLGLDYKAWLNQKNRGE